MGSPVRVVAGALVELLAGDSAAQRPIAFDEGLGGGALGLLFAFANDAAEVGEELVVFALGDELWPEGFSFLAERPRSERLRATSAPMVTIEIVGP